MDKIIVFYFLRLKSDLPFDLDQNYYPFGLTRVCLKQAVYTEIAILIKFYSSFNDYFACNFEGDIFLIMRLTGITLRGCV